MKKTLTTLILALCVLVANAQYANKGGGSNNASQINQTGKVVMQSDKAIGDTLLYTSGYYWYPNAADAAGFNIQMEDIDALTPNNASFFTSFGSFYDTAYRADWWFPWDVDTAWYFAATSWFNPPGQAENWMEFGPITIPAGAELSWYQRYNGSGGTPPFWFDGYEVYVSTTGSDYTSFLNNGFLLFTRDDYTGSDGTDSSWMFHTVVIPSTYANQPCYFAFRHTANDMDVLYLDEIKVVETAAGVDEIASGILSLRNDPNPADQNTVINYQLRNGGNVVLQVMDVTGRIIRTNEFGVQAAGAYNYTLNTSDLSQGMYFYSLNVNNQKVVNKMIVER